MGDHDNGATVRLAATIARSRHEADGGTMLDGIHPDTIVEMALAAKREVDGLRTELAQANLRTEVVGKELLSALARADKARAERDEAIRERDESLPMSIGTAVLRALEPMDESEELTRADRLDYIATSHGEDSWSHDVLRAIAGAFRANAARARKGGE